jgi:hypothetical protein
MKEDDDPLIAFVLWVIVHPFTFSSLARHLKKEYDYTVPATKDMWELYTLFLHHLLLHKRGIWSQELRESIIKCVNAVVQKYKYTYDFDAEAQTQLRVRENYERKIPASLAQMRPLLEEVLNEMLLIFPNMDKELKLNQNSWHEFDFGVVKGFKIGPEFTLYLQAPSSPIPQLVIGAEACPFLNYGELSYAMYRLLKENHCQENERMKQSVKKIIEEFHKFSSL